MEAVKSKIQAPSITTKGHEMGYGWEDAREVRKEHQRGFREEEDKLSKISSHMLMQVSCCGIQWSYAKTSRKRRKKGCDSKFSFGAFLAALFQG